LIFYIGRFLSDAQLNRSKLNLSLVFIMLNERSFLTMVSLSNELTKLKQCYCLIKNIKVLIVVVYGNCFLLVNLKNW